MSTDEYRHGRKVVQKGDIGGREVLLLEGDTPDAFYIGPSPDSPDNPDNPDNPNEMFAEVRIGDGLFSLAYKLALKEGRFVLKACKIDPRQNEAEV